MLQIPYVDIIWGKYIYHPPCNGIITNMMERINLPKSSKSNHVDKLHTMLLLEADYSFNNKLGRDVMQAGEDTNIFAPE